MNTMRLIKKTKLTPDVYELVFVWDENLKSLAWQFITFILPSGLRRAYSISYQNRDNFEFIIKRLENWRWWSIEICDSEIWSELEFIWPVWHFVLKENKNDKLFIGTGTWFAPLYFQIKMALEKDLSCKLFFIFWVRNREDVFYENELNFLKNRYTNFDFKLFLSREDREWTERWYVTDFLDGGNIKKYEEFYICWNNVMVECSRQRLEENWIDKERIYFEKY